MTTLEKIRAEIEQSIPWNTEEKAMKSAVLDIIDRYAEQEQTGHCKDCKYFEYDSAVKVYGVPLIVAHEICNRWGDGCKTKEDGYCFLFEESEDKNDKRRSNRNAEKR